jgi:hypothetical protein
MKQKENGNSTVGQAANFSEDFEREALKDSVYLLEEQQRIMQEINEEEHRLPAKITLLTPLPEPKQDESQVNTLPF